MNRARVLLVDDEPDILHLLELTLQQMDLETVSATTLTEARDLLTSHHCDFCLTDMRLPDGDGIDLVRHIQENSPHIPTAMITAHGNVDIAVDAMKAGAFDFVSKPVNLKDLRKLVTHALKLAGNGERQRKSPPKIIGDSKITEQLRQTIIKLARSQAPVQITGESGTGKELVARSIHWQSARRDGPFIPVNCGAIPAELIESEFFGHRKGSFTGATANKEGLFKAADGGTLFLDEIADLPLTMQVKLLRAIQEKAIRPIGEESEISVDVRIISATHRDLEAMVKAGEFRQDLFYRIHVIGLTVPPLRQRREDIPLLVNHFLQRLEQGSGAPLPRLGDTALAALEAYRFPGNIRELENILERAIALAGDEDIQPEDLHLSEHAIDPAVSELQSLRQASNTPELELDNQNLETYLEDLEKEAIIEALEKTRWNKTEAAKLLGISFRAIRYRLKKLGID